MADFHMCRVIDPRFVDPDSLVEVAGVIDGLAVVFVSAKLLEGGGRADHSVLFPVDIWSVAEGRNRCDGIFFTADELDGQGPGSDSDPQGDPQGGPGTTIGDNEGLGPPPGSASAPFAMNLRTGSLRRSVAEPVTIGVGAPKFVRQPGGGVKRRKGDPTIVGIAAVYYDGTPRTEFQIFPGLVERIMPGAFDDVIERGDDVLALFNHDRNLVLGRTGAGTLSLTSTRKGLAYRIFPGNTTVGADVLEHISRRDVTGSSFSFQPIKETWTRDTARELDVVQVDEVTIGDVGPVTLPAYKATVVEVSRTRAVVGLAGRLAVYRRRASSL